MKSRHYWAGIIGGLVGGLVLSFVLGLMGALPMIAGIVGSGSATVGWFVHMILSAIAGLIFAWLFGNRSENYNSGTGYGLLFGAIWWIAAALILMPLFAGAPIQLGMAFSAAGLVSLIGYLIFGLVLGLVFVGMDKPHVVYHRHAPTS